MSRPLFGGAFLLELKAREWDYAYVMEHTSLSSEDEVKDLIFGDMPLTTALAEEIGALFETSGELWMNLYNAPSLPTEVDGLWFSNIGFPCALEPDDERNRVEFEIQCGGMEVYTRHMTYPFRLRVRNAIRLLFKGIHETDIIVGYEDVGRFYSWLREHSHMFNDYIIED